MDKYSAEEIASITNEINYIKKLFENDLDRDMHLSCSKLNKGFQGIDVVCNKISKLDDYNKDVRMIKDDTLDICKLVANSIVNAEDISN